jgi:hypothetical protein
VYDSRPCSKFKPYSSCSDLVPSRLPHRQLSPEALVRLLVYLKQSQLPTPQDNQEELPDNQISYPARQSYPNITQEMFKRPYHQSCHHLCSLELQSTSLAQDTPLGLNSFPASLSFARLELEVFGILVVTALHRLSSKLGQSNTIVSLGPFQVDEHSSGYLELSLTITSCTLPRYAYCF